MSESLVDWGVGRVPAADWCDGARQARVVRVDRGECDVMTPDGRVRVLSDSQRAQGEIAPVTGDWVEIGDTEAAEKQLSEIRRRGGIGSWPERALTTVLNGGTIASY